MFDPKDSRTVGYHLFYLPPGRVFLDLQNIISDLAVKYGGPKFEPHVTLLARIPTEEEKKLIEKTMALANVLKPVEVALEKILMEDTYFRALYCKAGPNSTLDHYHQKALEIFGMEDVNGYFPHLSLYYGNISQAEKEEAVRPLSLPATLKFTADRIYLYRTDGEAQDWTRVGEYPLRG